MIKIDVSYLKYYIINHMKYQIGVSASTEDSHLDQPCIGLLRI